MGSRITRAVFKDERSRPIDKHKIDEISDLATLFFSFIACLYFFLFGYLYRPYLKQHPSLYFTPLLLFLTTRAFPPSSKAILLSLLLFVVMIVTHLAGIPCLYLKGGLILSAVLFATLSNSDLVGNPYRQALLLWGEYQCFWLGLSLSQDVERVNSLAGKVVGLEDTMLVKTMFSLVGTMALTLASFGKGFLRKKMQPNNKQIGFKQQIPYALVAFTLLLAFLIIKHALLLSVSLKFLTLFVSSALILGLKAVNIEKKTWMVVAGLIFCIFFVDFVVESQNSVAFMLNIAKAVVVNLVCFDGIRIWSGWMITGTQKPSLTILVYFTAVYLVLLSNIISAYLSEISSMAWIFGVVAYGGMVGWDYCHRRNYELLP